jgi:hypothetical protein
MRRLRSACQSAHRGETVELERIVARMRSKWGMKYKEIANVFIKVKAVEDAHEFEDLMQEVEYQNQWRQ